MMLQRAKEAWKYGYCQLSVSCHPEKSEEQSVFWETKTLKFGYNKRNGSTSKRGPGKPFANQLTPSKTDFWPSWLFNVLSSTFFRRGLGSSRNGDDEATRIESSPSQERGNYYLFLFVFFLIGLHLSLTMISCPFFFKSQWFFSHFVLKPCRIFI